MEDNTTTMHLNLESNIDAENAKAKKLSQTLKEAGYGRTTYAAAAASKGVANAAAATGGAAGQNAEDSNVARGIAGQTGAAGRDFAAQAQGLGGLVHVYATFAANLFAVSAAFTALSKAANVTNMIKGLDQLGAASGRNLGTLAKSLVEVSDGAISLADSMTAVAQATSGGMSSKNILRMTEVAKKASQALGRDMSDALSRLSRGITKIEPELLDEIGIMVKVNEASETYARQLGKTVSSLTDFEKRQGYANAVLAEGEKKFGNINLDANPYQKILASITDLMYSGGELVNKVLGPMLTLLSQSPAALATALGALATILLKQAIPAIGMFRENAKRMADEAHRRVENQVAEQKSAVQQGDEIANQAAQREFERADKTAKRMAALQRSQINSKLVGGDVKRLMSTETPFTISPEGIAKIKAQRDELLKSDNKLYKEQGDKLTKFLARSERIRQESRDAGYAAVVARGSEETASMLAHETQKQKILDKLNLASAKRNILSNVAETNAILGPTAALKQLREETSKLDTNRISKGFTTLKGSLSIVSGAVGTAVNAFSMWGQAIALVGVGVAILDGWMSKSAKEADAYAKAINNTESSFDNITRTLELIEKKTPLEAFSIESLQAKANALNDLNDSLKDTIFKFDKLQSAMGDWGWDRFFDGIWDLFGKGSADKLSKALSGSVVNALKLLEEGPAKEEAKKIFENILGQQVDFANIDKVNSAIKDLDKEALRFKATELWAEVDKVNKVSNNAASNLTGIKSVLAEIGKESDKIATSLQPTDSFSKSGIMLIDVAGKMGEALKEPINGLRALIDLAGDLKTLSFLPPGLALELATSKKSLEALAAELVDINREKVRADEAAKEASKKYSDQITSMNKPGAAGSGAKSITGGPERLLAAVIASNKAQADVQTRREIADAKLKVVNENWARMGAQMFIAGTKELEIGLSRAFGEARLTIEKGFASILKGVGGDTSNIDAALAKREIDLQIQELEARVNNTEQLFLLTKEVELKRLQDERLSLLQQKSVTQNQTDTDIINSKLATVIQAEKDLTIALKTAKGGSSAIISQHRDAANQAGGSANNISAGLDNTSALGVAKELMPLYVTLIQQAGAIAKFNAQKVIIDINKQIGSANYLLDAEQKRREEANKILQAKQTELTNAQTLAGVYSQSLQEDKIALENEILSNQLIIDKNKLVKDIVTTTILLNSLASTYSAKELETNKQYNSALTEKEKQVVRLSNFEEESNSRKRVSSSKQIQEEITGKAQLLKIEQENAAKILAANDSIRMSTISTTEVELSARKQLGTIQSEDLIAKTNSLDISKQSIAYEQQKLTVMQSQTAAITELNNRIKAAETARDANAINSQQYKQLDTSVNTLKGTRDDAVAVNSAVLAQNEALNAAVLKKLEIEKETSLELAKQEETTRNIVSLTESLALLFGKVGAGIGAAVGIMNTMAKKQEAFAINKIKLEKEAAKYAPDSNDDVKDIKFKNNAIEENAKLQKKLDEDTAISQLNNISAISAAGKSMFEEKTAAYKIFDAVQKASAAMSMALQVQQMATELAALPAKIAGGVSKLFSQGGWAGFAGAAAFLALMASLGAGSGGTSVPAAGATAADMQKSQGTGQSWQYDSKTKSNVLKETGGGVLGDAEAKTESIKNSLEIIKNNTIDGLGYDSRMLKALQSIDEGVNNTAKSLYNIPGLRSGSITGTADTSTSTSGIKGLFGKSTTKDIIDSGLEISGTFSQLSKNAAGLVKAYETIRTTNKSSGFLGIGAKTSVSDSKNYMPVTKDVEAQITEIFSNAAMLFTTVGEKIGLTANDVQKKLDKIDIGKAFTSLRGLKGDELEKEFNAVIGSILDSAAGTVFDSMKKYQNFGEGLLETTVRVVDGYEKVKVALHSIGVTTSKTSDVVITMGGKFPGLISSMFGSLTNSMTTSVEQFTYDVTEALIKGAGDIENFTSQLTFFSDNFLTEAERLAPITENVNKVMGELGLSSVNTREGFANVVRGLDLTTAGGQAVYQSMMDIAPAFAMVYAETRKLVSEEEKLAGLREQYVTILELEGKLLESISLSREIELENMTESLKVGQKYIWAMQDEVKLKTEVTTAYEKEMSAFNNIISQYTEIRNLEGNTLESLAVSRQVEIDATVEALRAGKKYIWAMQDELDLKNKLKTAYDKEITALKNTISQISEIAALEGDTLAATTLSREAELSVMEDSLKAGKQYIWAMQDEAALKSKLTTAYNNETAALNSTISTLKSSIKTLDDYKESLKVGELSVLTPEQKYKETKANAMKVAAIASGIAITDAEKAAKEAAISDLPGVASTFLDASRTLWASSEQYTADYNAVLGVVTSTSSALKAQLTDAEKQLQALEDSYAMLGMIETAVDTVASLTPKIIAAQEVTAQMMANYYGPGGPSDAILNEARNQLNVLIASYDALNLVANATLTVAELTPQLIAAQEVTASTLAAYYGPGGQSSAILVETQLQMQLLAESYSALNIIADNTYTTAQLIPMLIQAQNNTTAAMNAYYASGGVSGTTPTTVTPVVDTGNPSQDAVVQAQIQNAQMVQQLTQLNTQMTALRIENQTQTDQINTANYRIAQLQAVNDKLAADAAAAAAYNNTINQNYLWSTGGGGPGVGGGGP